MIYFIHLLIIKSNNFLIDQTCLDLFHVFMRNHHWNLNLSKALHICWKLSLLWILRDILQLHNTSLNYYFSLCWYFPSIVFNYLHKISSQVCSEVFEFQLTLRPGFQTPWVCVDKARCKHWVILMAYKCPSYCILLAKG